MTADPRLTEGELWVREALAELRDSGFRPAGIARFISESERRAAMARAARPGLVRQARTWCYAGALAWVAPAAAGIEPFRRRIRPGLVWWGLTALMLDRHLGMMETEAGEPRSLGPADALTLSRAWLVPLAADDPGPVVCVAGLLSDALDGPLARAGAPTRAGRDLEGLADVAFAAAAIRGAERSGRLPRAAAAVEFVRLGAGVAFAVWSYFGRGTRPDPALLQAGRATTAARAAGLVAASAGRRRTGGFLIAAGALAALRSVARSSPPQAVWPVHEYPSQ